MRTWTNSPDREFASREDAALWKCWLMTFRTAAAFVKGGEYVTSEEIIREAKRFAETARIEVADLPKEGDELDRYGLQELQDREVLQHRPTNARRVAGDMAGGIHPVRHAAAVESEIDRIISDLERGEGSL